jgi:TPR repeat protein
VDRDMSRAIQWWMRAAEHDVPEARDALRQLRRTADSPAKRDGVPAEAARTAFAAYRGTLWEEHPALERNGQDSVGAALLAEGRAADAVPVLIREAWALGAGAETALAQLYTDGRAPGLAPYDPRILNYFREAADEGRPAARVALARIYASGAGVPRDVARARSLIADQRTDEAKTLLKELAQ